MGETPNLLNTAKVEYVSGLVHRLGERTADVVLVAVGALLVVLVATGDLTLILGIVCLFLIALYVLRRTRLRPPLVRADDADPEQGTIDGLHVADREEAAKIAALQAALDRRDRCIAMVHDVSIIGAERGDATGQPRVIMPALVLDRTLEVATEECSRPQDLLLRLAADPDEPVYAIRPGVHFRQTRHGNTCRAATRAP